MRHQMQVLTGRRVRCLPTRSAVPRCCGPSAVPPSKSRVRRAGRRSVPSGGECVRVARCHGLVVAVLSFANPGESGYPEPYGKIWLTTKSGASFRLWTQGYHRTVPSISRFSNALDLPFTAADIASINVIADEEDSGNADDNLARGAKPFTGNGTCTCTTGDGSVTVDLTIT